MENNSDAKQLIIDRVKQATNILVTVENNPSVDELAAALALTLMLNKMDKHATAVFSGAVPPAINFLEPTKTFENTVDSLRDFIIALDKEKADRLRYKVEDDVVKIFITPYQSTITEKDLHFSQGDFNVEVVMALGVEKRESLDRAIAAHGRILHDATVITINARDEHSSLGTIDWQDGKSSSICEMLVGLADSLQPKMLDTQISTALLTGVVAATGRFANEHTTPHAMTIAAELMAAGANQQLIANNLQQTLGKAEETKPAESAEGKIDRGPKEPTIGDLTKESKKVDTPAEPPADGSKGEMKVRHEEAEEEKPKEILNQVQDDTSNPIEKEDQAAAAIPTVADELSGLKEAVQSAADNPPVSTPRPAQPTFVSSAPTQAQNPASLQAPVLEEKFSEPRIKPLGQNLESGRDRGASYQRLEPPTLGGTLNATSAEAEESRRLEAEEEAKHNNVTLSHGGSGIQNNRTLMPPARPAANPPMPSTPTAPMSTPGNSNLPPLPPIQQQPPAPFTPPSAPTPPASPSPDPNKQSIEDLEAARKAVDDALAGSDFSPANQPVASLGAQPMQVAPASSPAPAPMPAPSSTPPPAPTPLPGSQANGGLPPLPDFNTLPPLPPLPGAPSNNANSMQAPTIAPGTDVTAQLANPATNPGTALPPIQQPPAAPAPGQVVNDPNNPNQFRIPGQ